MLCHTGAELAFAGLELSTGAHEIALDYSLAWHTGSNSVVVEVYLDDSTTPLAAMTDLEPVDDWNQTRRTTVTFDVGVAGSHTLRLRLADASASWGIQIDRIRVR